MSQPEILDLLVVGCGPTGAVLANLLGARGLKLAVIEQDTDVYSVCRATHLDQETLRNFQLTGLMPELEQACAPFGSVEIRSGGRVLMKESVDRPGHGYAGSVFFDQPAFERVLRRGLRRYPGVSLYAGYTVASLSQDHEGVSVEAVSAAGSRRAFRARWLVGCDGGRSFVRTSLGIGLDQLAEARQWLVVDALLLDPDDAQRLPAGFRYLLDSERLTIYAHGFGRNRRWEFQLDEREPVPDRATVEGWLAEYIEPSRLELVRCERYAHLSLVARSWRSGRVLLAGDAAHMMPPAAGQGLCSGVRDAVNLAWKLEAVIRGRANHDLLESYEAERRGQVETVLKGAVFINRRLQATTPLGRWWRRTQIALIGALPPVQSLLRRFSLPVPRLSQGALSRKSWRSGQHLPQFCTDHRASDQVLGYDWVLLGRELPPEAAVCRAQGIRVLALDELAPWQSQFGAWLRGQDFALIRPDKIVFATGRSHQLAQVLAERAACLGLAIGPVADAGIAASSVTEQREAA